MHVLWRCSLRYRIWRQRWYHIRMDKTTIYLPDDLKEAVKRASQRQGVSEAEVIRESVRSVVGGSRPKPQSGLFNSVEPTARRADEFLVGFGER